MVSPLPKAFCPNSVSQLSDEMLLRIGSEPEQQTLRRDKLIALAQGLRRSLKDLQVPLYCFVIGVISALLKMS
jgi:hypothetical protein